MIFLSSQRQESSSRLLQSTMVVLFQHRTSSSYGCASNIDAFNNKTIAMDVAASDHLILVGGGAKNKALVELVPIIVHIAGG